MAAYDDFDDFGGADPLPEPTEKDYTLCFVRRCEGGVPQLLLGMKKRGFGAGRWNGFGGKVEDGESFEQAAIRELQEESGLVAGSVTKRGYLVFYMEDTRKTMKVHVYEANDVTGEAVEGEEMRPQWFNETDIPFDDMWPDDRHWLPMLLQGKQFLGRFQFEDEDTLSDFTLREY